MAKAKDEEKPPPAPLPRCTNCAPWFVRSKDNPNMGMCRRNPGGVVIRNAEGDWCGEHPSLRGAPIAAVVTDQKTG